jgi:uncharacterized protein (DUF1697 family)
MPRQVALLRGINVGVHKKVPMAQLKAVLEGLGFAQVETLLNSGNVAFDGDSITGEALADTLAQAFGFAIPTLVHPQAAIQALVALQPFAGQPAHKDIRWYVTFLPQPVPPPVPFPHPIADGALTLLSQTELALMSVLDVRLKGSVEAYTVWERLYGKDITTRTWDTVMKLSTR